MFSNSYFSKEFSKDFYPEKKFTINGKVFTWKLYRFFQENFSKALEPHESW